MNMANNARNTTWNELPIFLLLALAGYLLPWAIAPNSAMTLNAFDLAEWTSLHPIQRQASPPLITPLLLRAQLAIFAILITLWATSRIERILALLCVLLLTVAQLPPLEFLHNSSDANYRQQAILAFATLIISAGLVFMPQTLLRFVFAMLVAIMGIVTSLAGQSQAIELYQVTLEQGEIGGGLLLIVLAYTAIALSALRQRQIRR